MNLKISKNREIYEHYNKKLFVRNYFSKCSEVHLKINLCYQWHGSVSCEVFPSKHSQSYRATWSGQASTI